MTTPDDTVDTMLDEAVDEYRQLEADIAFDKAEILAKRQRQIALLDDLRRQGVTLRAIADAVELSVQRVHQLVSKASS